MTVTLDAATIAAALAEGARICAEHPTSQARLDRMPESWWAERKRLEREALARIGGPTARARAWCDVRRADGTWGGCWIEAGEELAYAVLGYPEWGGPADIVAAGIGLRERTEADEAEQQRDEERAARAAAGDLFAAFGIEI